MCGSFTITPQGLQPPYNSPIKEGPTQSDESVNRDPCAALSPRRRMYFRKVSETEVWRKLWKG